MPENREFKKKKIQFFPSKTYIVDKCWHFCSHLERVTNFLPKLVDMLFFSVGKKADFPFFKFPIFGCCCPTCAGFELSWLEFRAFDSKAWLEWVSCHCLSSCNVRFQCHSNRKTFNWNLSSLRTSFVTKLWQGAQTWKPQCAHVLQKTAWFWWKTIPVIRGQRQQTSKKRAFDLHKPYKICFHVLVTSCVNPTACLARVPSFDKTSTRFLRSCLAWKFLQEKSCENRTAPIDYHTYNFPGKILNSLSGEKCSAVFLCFYFDNLLL